MESRKTMQEKDLEQNKEINSQTVLMDRRVKQPSRSFIVGFSQFDAKMGGRRRQTRIITMPCSNTVFFSEKLLTHGDRLQLFPELPSNSS